MEVDYFFFLVRGCLIFFLYYANNSYIYELKNIQFQGAITQF